MSHELSYCPLGGYLVRGDLPNEPVDHDVEGLSRLGCNRLRCGQCHESVRSVLTGGVRQYECRCSHWTQQCAESPLDDPEPDQRTPSVPWRCEGHPRAELPMMLDGVEVTAANLTELITRSLHGWTPPGAHPEAKLGAYWAARMYVRFEKTVHADVVVRAAVAGLDAPDPLARARAQHFFYLVPLPVGAERALELLQGERALFAGVPYRIEGIAGDDTLEDGLWHLAAPLVAEAGAARDLARSRALAPGRPSRGIYHALARGDAEWLAAHLEDVARANPDHVESLAFAIRVRFGRVRAAPLLERLSAHRRA